MKCFSSSFRISLFLVFLSESSSQWCPLQISFLGNVSVRDLSFRRNFGILIKQAKSSRMCWQRGMVMNARLLVDSAICSIVPSKYSNGICSRTSAQTVRSNSPGEKCSLSFLISPTTSGSRFGLISIVVTSCPAFDRKSETKPFPFPISTIRCAPCGRRGVGHAPVVRASHR